MNTLEEYKESIRNRISNALHKRKQLKLRGLLTNKINHKISNLKIIYNDLRHQDKSK